VNDLSPRTALARRLFAPLGPTYDRSARLLSFGQDPRWRRFLVSRVRAAPDDVVLDVATGTAAVAIELVRAYGCRVVGLDQSPEMLAAARFRLQQAALAGRVELVEGRAEELPFDDRSFDALTFTYLLRYVDDPAATLRELARVVRPGATIASLEFAVPPAPLTRALWELYVGVGLPALGSLLGREWGEVGAFLRASIRDFYRRYVPASLLELWREAGIDDVHLRFLSFGGGLVVWGARSG
jgi:demethylmenaquinone methyltransferase/2-methoxy-6-polyprenyl-1,4-benzoquinol methylase